MKQSITILIILTFVFTGCKYKKKAEELNKNNQELTSELNQRDSTINALLITINEIDSNLGKITSKQKELEKIPVNANIPEKIKKELQDINNLMAANEKRITQLIRTVSRYKGNLSALNTTVDQLQQKISEQSDQLKAYTERIAQLNREVETQDSTIDRMQSMNQMSRGEIHQLTRLLNTAYYIVGSRKELEDKNIILKEGGFLGLFGKVEKPNPNDNPEDFIRINITTDTIIDIMAAKKDVHIITYHSPESYAIKELGNERSELDIYYPQLFWEASKYLIVMTK